MRLFNQLLDALESMSSEAVNPIAFYIFLGGSVLLALAFTAAGILAHPN